MTTTDKDVAQATARLLRGAMESRVLDDSLRATLRAEADRLDPPAPTGKTVTWRGTTYWRDAAGSIVYGNPTSAPWGVYMAAEKSFLDAVVLPLLADAPDGPIPDETVEKAWRVYAVIDDEVPVAVVEKERPNGMHYMRAALEAVRGLPGMAVVRAGKPPEVLRWASMTPDGFLSLTYAEKAHVPRYAGQRVVAIIADPGEEAP